jgi:hypothetical protein
MNVQTVNRHLTQLGTILKFARLNGFDVGDPTSLASARRTDKRKQKEKRNAFSRAELATLFGHAVWA